MDYLPHSACLRGDSNLIALHIFADLVISAAYLAIPALAVLFLLQANSSRVFRAYLLTQARTLSIFPAIFVLSCGAGHAINAATFYVPCYWIEGAWKLLTAAISFATAVALARLALYGPR